jgi:two-component system phosphate regulon sensor histidine kinase PhoR
MAVTIFMFYSYQKQILISAEDELLSELNNKWEVVRASGVLELPLDESHAKLRKISDSTPLRITLIRSDGVVLDDSYLNFDEIVKMENHRYRPEVASAIETGKGSEIRFSATTGIRMMYYARQLGSEGDVLRLAYPIIYVDAIKTKMKEQAYLTLGVLFGVLFIVLWFISLRVSSPVVKLSRIVEDIEKGRMPVFPIFKSRLMDKVAGLIYRTYHALEYQRSVVEMEKKELKELVNLLDEGILKLDKNGLVQTVNDKLQKILGCTLDSGDDVLAKVTDMDAIVLMKEVLSYTQDCTKVFDLKNTVYEIYVRFMEGNRIIVMTDITGSERYETYKSELITNISHELKTPLALVMGYAETLIEHDNMKEEDKKKFLSKIFKGTTQLNQLINDVIELHRYETSSEEDMEKAEETDLQEFVEEMREYYSDKFGPGIRFKAAGDSVGITRAHVSSLLTNLIDNAVAYSGRDYIDVLMKSGEGVFTLEVSDGGPAIPAEERERIFERFYTVSKSRNKSISSTGLGLSIVKHICRLYRGNISHRQNERGGNTFTAVAYVPE